MEVTVSQKADSVLEAISKLPTLLSNDEKGKFMYYPIEKLEMLYFL